MNWALGGHPVLWDALKNIIQGLRRFPAHCSHFSERNMLCLSSSLLYADIRCGPSELKV